MSSLWLIILTGSLTGAMGPGIPVLYATYGELLVERAGRINLGTEGSMVMGACFGFIATVKTGNVAIGVLAGSLAGGLLSLIYAYLVIIRHTNQLATGFTLALFGAGITAYAGKTFVGSRIEGINLLPIPLLADIPLFGKAFFQQDILTYIAYIMGPLLWAFLRYTRPGLSLRAVGEQADIAFAGGRNPAAWQFGAIIAGGMLAGIGGAELSLGLTHCWIEGMTQGRGFIAVALVIFSMWNPLRAMVGAFLFGGAIGFQLQLQSIGAPISPFVLDMFPYVITLFVLTFWTGIALRAMPDGLKEVLKMNV